MKFNGAIGSDNCNKSIHIIFVYKFDCVHIFLAFHLQQQLEYRWSNRTTGLCFKVTLFNASNKYSLGQCRIGFYDVTIYHLCRWIDG